MTGKRPQESGFKREVDARRALNKVLREIDERGSVERSKMLLGELVDEYLAQYSRSERTKKKLATLLKRAEPLRGLRLCDVSAPRLNRWLAGMPTESLRWNVFRSVRQVLNYGVAMGYLRESPANALENPEPNAPDVRPFESWEQVEAVAKALGSYWCVPIFAVGTGLRPAEWIALEWNDVDLEGGLCSVERAFSAGRHVKLKTDRSRREVPLRDKVVDALREHRWPGPR